MAMAHARLAAVDASPRARREPGTGAWRTAWHGWLAAVRRFEAPRASAMRAGDRAGAAGRDAAALDFDAFLQRFERDVWGYLWRMTGDEQAAYDLAQETFVRAWQHFEQVHRYDRPKAWLFRVATNLALNHLRHGALVYGTTLPLEAGEQVAGESGDLARRVAERDAVRRALLELVPRQRAALVLREVQGLSCDEVARALGISGAAAKMLLFRAREQFRASYARQEER